MSVGDVLEIGEQALRIAALVAAPILLTALGVGLVVGILQAATQLQETTLSFIPKLLGVGLMLVIAGPWMLSLLVDWFRDLLLRLPGMLG
ncbi:MAG TPA: flagellar biosynthesis protein FliQ [Gammaproteobacteria bacterium]|nr:flagellar biosynthesis protein FliQ [Gammaproteobacteria bacterium]